MRQTGAGRPQNGMRDHRARATALWLAITRSLGPRCRLRPLAIEQNSKRVMRSGTMSFLNVRRILVAATAAVALVSVVQATDISGAGATFPTPIYSKWA